MTQQFQISHDDAGERLDQFLCARMANEASPAALSRARVQQWIAAGHVRVNDAPSKPGYRLRAGDAVLAAPAAPPPLHAVPEAIPLDVLYEDAHLVAIHKPAGMVVHAGAGVHEGTLVNALLYRYADGLSYRHGSGLASLDRSGLVSLDSSGLVSLDSSGLATGSAEERPGIVHRLDRFTSGVILVARTDLAHQHLAAQFAGRTIQKHYLALVHGSPRDDKGLIDKPIARDPVHRARMSARQRNGRTALTEFTVLHRFARYTFLDLRIGTGRTHQIRVHLSSIGHPVVGDRLYGAPVQPPDMPAPERYFLHAHRIAFTHPHTGERMEIVAPLTADIQAWMRLLE